MECNIQTAAGDGNGQARASTERVEELTKAMNTIEDIQKFLSKDSDVGLNDVDREGRTILMIACKRGREDMAQFLLGKGADPNKKCKELNTALHFACIDVHIEYLLFLRNEKSLNYDKTSVEILRLVEMLLNHGATFDSNSHGCTPACYAAISGLRNVVDHFFINHRVPLSTSSKIETLEILVFALSILHDDTALARKYLLRALNLRLENGLQRQSDGPSHLEESLEQRECTIPEGIGRILE